MCGILGIIQPTGTLVSEDHLAKMGETQVHRGPDNFSILIRGSIGLAHNRLSIIDLSAAGNQPFTDGKHALTFNGEIYNYLAIKQELMKAGVSFVSTSDTEVLFAALVHWGVETALKRVQGMFAFAFVNFETQQVYLCRDRYGIKPLFYTSHQGSLYWASEVKAFRRVIPIRLDPVRTLFSSVGIGERMNVSTLFEGVKHVPPASYVRCRSDENPSAPTAYYDVLDDISEDYYKELSRLTWGSVVERFRGLLERSVKGMLMSDAPMGAFVSGGIDSSLLAALAVKYDSSLSLFTADTVGEYSERAQAEAVAKAVNRPLSVASFMPDMFIEHWANVTWFYETPIVSHTNAIPFAAVARHARQCGVKAVLTGEGADELFLGYPRLVAQRFDPIVKGPLVALQKLYGLFPPLRKYAIDTVDGGVHLLVKTVTDFERQRFREEGISRYGFLPTNQVQLQYQSIQMLREHLVALLHRNDRMGMMYSIESRFPFLDEEVIRFAINLPWKRKIEWSLRLHDWKHPFLVDKAIVRRTAAQLLPRDLCQKRKEGFPMYGHRHLKVRSGFFKNGYLEKTLGLSLAAQEYLLRTQAPYFIAKLASVDIFGRIFGLDYSIGNVADHIVKHVEMVPRKAD